MAKVDGTVHSTTDNKVFLKSKRFFVLKFFYRCNIALISGQKDTL